MKTAVSIPTPLFKQIDRLARRTGRTRSAVVSAALAEYAARHTDDEITAAIDRVCAAVGGDTVDPALQAAAAEILRRVEWE
jgi:predicted transcriptional regulator